MSKELEEILTDKERFQILSKSIKENAEKSKDDKESNKDSKKENSKEESKESEDFKNDEMGSFDEATEENLEKSSEPEESEEEKDEDDPDYDEGAENEDEDSGKKDTKGKGKKKRPVLSKSFKGVYDTALVKAIQGHGSAGEKSMSDIKEHVGLMSMLGELHKSMHEFGKQLKIIAGFSLETRELAKSTRRDFDNFSDVVEDSGSVLTKANAKRFEEDSKAVALNIVAVQTACVNLAKSKELTMIEVIKIENSLNKTGQVPEKYRSLIENYVIKEGEVK